MQTITLQQRIITFLSSRLFFGLIVAFFVIQAAWLAFSGVFPMAFDEDFHLGIIKIYAEQTSPFLGNHPPGADAFGAITRDPSYLYHYLMSFPYRVISTITDNATTQIIILRFMNIAFIASALFLWRSVLLKTKASPAIIHLCLLLFTLLPIVPFLAAHINYDNLFIPAVALVFLFAARIATSISNKQSIKASDAISLLIICLVTSLIKYAFLPIFVAVVVYFGVLLYLNRWHRNKITKSLIKSWKGLHIAAKIALVAGLLITGILFSERYAVNMVRYHEPVPDCAKVLSVEQCMKYGPWGRDYDIAANKPSDTTVNPFAFSYQWVKGMWLRTFFAVGGQTTAFDTKGPLLIPATISIFIAVFSLIVAAIYWRDIWRRYQKPVIALFLIIIIVYIGLLWLDRFQSYVKLGQTVALNGRYLVPIALPIMLFGALGINEVLKQRTTLRLVVASVVVIGYLLGGGALTFILRSDNAWLWNNKTVIQTNQTIRNTVGPVIPGYKSPELYMSAN